MNLLADPYQQRKIGVMIVDDQTSVSELLCSFLATRSPFAVKAEAAGGLDGLRLSRRYKPEMIICGLALPQLSGAGMIHAVRQEQPHVRIIVYTGTRNITLLREGLKAAPHGFVHKTESLQLLDQALKAVAGGSRFLSPYADQITEEAQRCDQPASRLTTQERTILKLVAEGLSSKRIADELHISPKTVEHHRLHVMRKLSLRDIASLTRYAVQTGMVQVD